MALAESPQTMPQLLEAAAAASPEAPFLLAPGRRPMAYADAVRQVRDLAGALARAGLGRGDVAAAVTQTGPENVLLFLAVGSLGAALAPLNPALKRRELEAAIGQLRPKLALSSLTIDAPVVKACASLGVPVIAVSPDAEGPAGAQTLSVLAGAPMTEAPASSGLPFEPALMIQTSGTTGTSKWVALSHANLHGGARTIRAATGMSAQDRGLGFVPQHHIGGWVSLVAGSLSARASVVCTRGFDAPSVSLWLEEHAPTWFTSTPTMLAVLVELARAEDLPPRHALRWVQCSAGKLPEATRADFERLFKVRVLEGYGLTETTGFVACSSQGPTADPRGAVGRVIGAEVAIHLADGTRAEAGQRGEIVVRGPGVITRYAGDPEASRGAFTPEGWLKTGDAGRLDARGYLYVEGRVRDQINQGGEKISPLEVDEALGSHPAVAEVAAFGVPDETLGETVAAAVVVKPGLAVTAQDLLAHASAHLAQFKLPSRVFFVPEIPKTDNGKPKRSLLRDRYASAAAAPPPAGPAGAEVEVEGRLAQILGEALGQPPVPIDQDFFQAGGDSFRVVRAVALAQDAGIPLTPRLVFAHPTVERLAQALGAEGRDGAKAQASALGGRSQYEVLPTPGSREHERLPLSFIEERQLKWWQQADAQTVGRVVWKGAWLEGPLNPSALREALGALLRRHDILRSRYESTNEGFWRLVPGEVDAPLREVDCQGSPNPEEAAMELLSQEAFRTFELTREPPLRFGLFKVRPDRHLFYGATDHVAADAEGSRLLWADLKAFYAARAAAGVEPGGPGLQYGDFALWQRKTFGDPSLLGSERAFWESRLAGAQPISRLLPTDFPRESVDRARAERYLAGSRIGRLTWRGRLGLAARLRAVARAANATLFTACLAAFGAVLGRRAGASEVVLSSINDYRRRVLGLDCVVGAFLNPTLLKVRLSESASWSGLIGATQVELNEVFSRVELPLIPLVFPKFTDFFRVIFNFLPRGATPEVADWPGCRAQPVARDRVPKPSLSHTDLVLLPQDGTLDGSLDYNAELWSQATAQKLVDDYQAALETMASAPGDRAF